MKKLTDILKGFEEAEKWDGNTRWNVKNGYSVPAVCDHPYCDADYTHHGKQYPYSCLYRMAKADEKANSKTVTTVQSQVMEF